MNSRHFICTLNGFVLTLSLVGCGGNNAPSATALATNTLLPSIYVIQNPTSRTSGTGMILQFPLNSSGNVSPTTTIAGPTGSFLNAISTDGQGNIYVVSNNATSVDVREYAAGSTGDATPVRLIPGTLTTRVGAVDGLSTSASGEIFVAEDYGGVQDFSATANGNVAPTRDILGAYETGGGLSTIGAANSVAADSLGNLYVVNQGYLSFPAKPLLIFGPTATGNVAPTGAIAGPLTTLTFANHVATDATGNIYVTGNSTNSGSRGAILVFGPGATGNIAPLRTISGPSTTIDTLGGITVDATGNIYVVSTKRGGTGPNPVTSATVLKFSATASGDAAPVSSFTSSAWTNPDNASSLAVH